MSTPRHVAGPAAALSLVLTVSACVPPDGNTRLRPGSGVATAPSAGVARDADRAWDAPPAADVIPAMAPVWRLRSALNALALGCRLSGDTALAGRYNQFLRHHRAALADAYAAEQDRYRRSHGRDWQSTQDTEMTRLYNHFAGLGSSPRRCAAGTAVAADAIAAEARDLPRLAASALPLLTGGDRRLTAR